MRLRATHFVNRAPCHTAWIGESYVAPAEKPCYLDYPVSTQYLTGQYLPAHCGWFAGPGMAPWLVGIGLAVGLLALLVRLLLWWRRQQYW